MSTSNSNHTDRSPLQLGPRFTRAIDYARLVHVENRKETLVPYMAHLLGVAALVMGENGYVRFPVTEDMVIAALLHDVVEDHGGMSRLQDIEMNFGHEVARIVEGCTDSFCDNSQDKAPWHERKSSYIERLRKEPEDTLIVSAADKLYNARAILEDYRVIGDQIWNRFKRGREDQLWYFRALIDAYESRRSNRLVEELRRVLAELERVSAGAVGATGPLK